jgi:PKD repeat protein
VTQIVISGSGFNSLDIANIVVKFWRNRIATGFTVNAGNSEITVTVPVGATTGKVTVTTPNGIAVSELPLMITA